MTLADLGEPLAEVGWGGVHAQVGGLDQDLPLVL